MNLQKVQAAVESLPEDKKQELEAKLSEHHGEGFSGPAGNILSIFLKALPLVIQFLHEQGLVTPE